METCCCCWVVNPSVHRAGPLYSSLASAEAAAAAGSSSLVSGDCFLAGGAPSVAVCSGERLSPTLVESSSTTSGLSSPDPVALGAVSSSSSLVVSPSAVVSAIEINVNKKERQERNSVSSRHVAWVANADIAWTAVQQQ